MAFVGAPLAFALLVSGGVAVRAQINHPQLVVRPVPAAVKVAAQDAARAEAPADAGRDPAPAQPEPQPTPPAPQVQATPAAEPKKDVAAVRARPKASRSVERAAGREALAARGAQPVTVQTAAVPAAGTIQLAILPWGEVFVNGKSRGVSPPLRSVELPPGTHTVEVRNTSFPTHTRRVEVRAGEPVRIRHRFR
jgi:serine/threonine-protein kinase